MSVAPGREILIPHTGSASGVIERVAGLDLMVRRKNGAGEKRDRSLAYS